jgi:hypothetical protein
MFSAIKRMANRTDALRRIALERWWDELRGSARAREPGRLIAHGRKVYSQNDEDGMVLEIFNRIGEGDRRFIEFGVQDGVECNTALLLMAGWSGLWLDGSDKYVAAARQHQAVAVGQGRLTVDKAFVTAENIDGLLGPWAGGTAAKPASVDLLSIDIDGNDYWIWEAITAVRPRVLIIEYNAAYPPPVAFVAEYKADRVWDGGNYHSASLASLEALGRAKGYALVGCNLSGANAFFVREEELVGPDGQSRFAAPYTAANHYEPPRYDLSGLPSGHPPRFGLNAAPPLSSSPLLGAKT